MPLRRLLREESPLPPDAVCVPSPREAAWYLGQREGNILLTTGAKELSAFGALDPRRLFPRVLPAEESLLACRRAGIPTRNIIALYGPFSQKLNEAILEQYAIRFLVTKDGGLAGGFPEKAAAAATAGVRLVVIRRPREQGEPLEHILTWLLSGQEAADSPLSGEASMERGEPPWK